MDTFTQVIEKTVAGYAGEGIDGYAILTKSEDDSLLTVVDISTVAGKREVYTSLVVQLVGERVIIEYDDNNKPLVDALLQAGVPRNQIVLAYAGEPVEEPTR